MPTSSRRPQKKRYECVARKALTNTGGLGIWAHIPLVYGFCYNILAKHARAREGAWRPCSAKQRVWRIIARPRCRGGKEGRNLAANLFVAGEVRKEGRRAPCSVFSHLVFITCAAHSIPPPSPTFLRDLGILQKARVALLFLQKLLSALKYPPPRTARGSTPTV